MNIYEVAQKHQKLIELVEAGEISEGTWQDTIDALEGELEERLESLTAAYKNRLARAEALRVEATNLTNRKISEEKGAENIKNFIDSIMQTADIKKLDAGVHSLSFRKGSEIVDINPLLVPSYKENEKLYTVVPESYKLIDKPALKALIKKGVEIEGVSVVRNPDSLQIK